MSKDSFKSFVRKYPSLMSFVNNKEKTWQEFYEMYELYGENSNVWNKYIYKTSNIRSSTLKPEEAVKELVTMIKGIDLASIQKGITNVQKTISLVQDLGIGSSKDISNYEARPTFRHLDD